MDLEEHLGYMRDGRRLEFYRQAIARAVRPGHRVLDLGCGTGVLGLFCLQTGAGHIVALDSTSMLEVARESLVRSGWADRVTFLRGDSRRVELDEPVDVVVCDQVGYFGIDCGIAETLQDARRRFLKPGGLLIPSRVRLRLAAVESASSARLADDWTLEVVPREFHWLRDRAVHRKYAVSLEAGDLLGPPADLGHLDFLEELPAFHSFDASVEIARAGTVHGLCGWFEADLAEGVTMTNSPLSDRAIARPQAFLPLSQPLAVAAGDRLHVTLMARPEDQILAWDVLSPRGGRTQRHATWEAEPLSGEDLARFRPGHCLELTREGRARLTVLHACDGTRTAQDLEEAIHREHPGLFPSRREASRFIARVLREEAR